MPTLPFRSRRLQIKRYFTGNLEASVPGYPPFPGKELNLLRAQIARITAGACVSPSGFFEVDEDAEPMSIKVRSHRIVRVWWSCTPKEAPNRDSYQLLLSLCFLSPDKVQHELQR